MAMEKPKRNPSREELYAYLDEEERARLDRLAARLARSGGGSLDEASLAALLPGALSRRAVTDGLLAEALAEPTTEAIGISVRREPERLTAHLFPIVGSMIRRAIQAYFQGLSEELDRRLARGLSLEGLRLRLESRRLGIPYHELLVARTLAFKVERALLIQPRSGLLAAEVAAEGLEAIDPDQIAAMLVAIRQFARDSFQAEAEGEGLSGIEFGGSRLLVVEGPSALLALVLRGSPSRALRDKAAETLELLHLRFGAALKAYSGNPQALAGAEPLLRACLLEEEKERAGGRKRYSRLLFLLLGLGLAFILGLGLARGLAEAAILRPLKALPGLRITEVERRGSHLLLRGLKDPLTDLPEPPRWTARLLSPEPLLSPALFFDPELALLRARRDFSLPGSVEVRVEGRKLRFSGTAAAAWKRQAAARPSILREAYELDFSGLRADYAAEERIAAALVSFAPESSRLVGQEETLLAVLEAFRELEAEAREEGRKALLVVSGFQYEDGAGLDLRKDRAAAVAQRLSELGLPPDRLRTEAVGVAEGGARTGRPERRVDFRVVYESGTP